MRRRAIRTAMIVAMGLLLVPTLAASAPGQRGGGSGSRGPVGHGSPGWGPRWQHWSGHGNGPWHGSGWWCCGGFAVGVGVGALVTAPWWAYPGVYAAPAYPAYPIYPAYPGYPVYPGYPAYPAAYPGYAVPSASYPAPPPPPAPGAPGSLVPTPEPFSSGPASPSEPSTGAAPSGPGAASATSMPVPAGCETVTVAGHWEMRVYSDGQRATVWIPTAMRSICR